jgi:general nucleoside transport system ATP-binding protein
MKNKLPLKIQKISKYFSGIAANNQIDLTLRQNEIHALLGENGSGKTTLMNIISGLYQPDKGDIFINGSKIKIKNPRYAIDNGIEMIHQHFMLIPGFTVMENIILGKEINKKIGLDLKNAKKKILDLSQNFGLTIDPDALVEDLPVGIQQKVEIMKALFRKASILIFDEPTAVLAPGEIDDLFKIMKKLTQNGSSIFFITHKLKEVMRIADRISIIRKGKLIRTTSLDRTNEAGLAKLMVGRKVILKPDKSPFSPGKAVLEVQNMTLINHLKTQAVKNVSFKVCKGEILGIAGVQGNGQTELAEAITGLRKINKGQIRFKNKRMPMLNPKKMIENGMAHIPEDRLKHGLVLSYSVAANQILSTYNKPPFARGLFRNHKKIYQESKKLIQQFDIRTPGPDALVKTLSGGNQQKVIISREFSRNIDFLLANQPCRGLDIGAVESIHKNMLHLRNKGIAILLISTELDEILTISDTIIVMYQGEIINKYAADQVNKNQLALNMIGLGNTLTV